MKNMMEYMGYYAVSNTAMRTSAFFGTIAGIADVISFEGNSPAELKTAFGDAVEKDYLDMCKRRGKEPQKAYKGSFNVRINPELHKRAVLSAMSDHISLNQLVERAVADYVKHPQ